MRKLGQAENKLRVEQNGPSVVAFSPVNKYPPKSMCNVLVCYSFPPQFQIQNGDRACLISAPRAPSIGSGGVSSEEVVEGTSLVLSQASFGGSQVPAPQLVVTQVMLTRGSRLKWLVGQLRRHVGFLSELPPFDHTADGPISADGRKAGALSLL